jgi:hypothetical protein
MREAVVTKPSFEKMSRSSSDFGACWANAVHPWAELSWPLRLQLQTIQRQVRRQIDFDYPRLRVSQPHESPFAREPQSKKGAWRL